MLPAERGIVQNRPDYFLAHRPLQPKREVADYVESEGILVPERFAGLEEALGSRKPFVARSEHPQDYDGASGIFSSLLISPERSTEALKDLVPGMWDKYGFRPGGDPRSYARLVSSIKTLTQVELEQGLTQVSQEKAELYCLYAKIPVDSFMRQVSYSYWEAIPGLNRAVIADSDIKDRYHISTGIDNVQYDPTKSGQRDNYMIVENGEVVAGAPQDLEEDTPENIRKLIQAYEAVRNLDRFSPDNCPTIELQSNGERQYFLQYLKGVDFNPARFSLDRPPEEGEIESVITRGSTPPQGVEVDFFILIITQV